MVGDLMLRWSTPKSLFYPATMRKAQQLRLCQPHLRSEALEKDLLQGTITQVDQVQNSSYTMRGRFGHLKKKVIFTMMWRNKNNVVHNFFPQGTRGEKWTLWSPGVHGLLLVRTMFTGRRCARLEMRKEILGKAKLTCYWKSSTDTRY